MPRGMNYNPEFKRSLEWARCTTDTYPMPGINGNNPDAQAGDRRSRYGQLEVAHKNLDYEGQQILAIYTGYVLGVTGSHAGRGLNHKIIGANGTVEISRKAHINLSLGAAGLKRHLFTHTGEVWVGDRSFQQFAPSGLAELNDLLDAALMPRPR